MIGKRELVHMDQTHGLGDPLHAGVGQGKKRTLTIHSFNKYLSRTCCVSGVAGGAEDTTMKKKQMKTLHLHGTYIPGERCK